VKRHEDIQNQLIRIGHSSCQCHRCKKDERRHNASQKQSEVLISAAAPLPRSLKRKAEQMDESLDIERSPKVKRRPAYCPDKVVAGRREGNVRSIVVYTDGACSRNGSRGARAGWGVFWPEGVSPASDLHGLNESKRLPEPLQTNFRAEMMGIIRAIQLCPDPNAQLTIYTDCYQCIDGMYSGRRWNMPSTNVLRLTELVLHHFAVIAESQWKWRRNGWKKGSKPVQDKDLIRLLEREMRKRSHRPKLVHVKAHATNSANNQADR
jgi:ribonuclease HI